MVNQSLSWICGNELGTAIAGDTVDSGKLLITAEFIIILAIITEASSTSTGGPSILTESNIILKISGKPGRCSVLTLLDCVLKLMFLLTVRLVLRSDQGTQA